MIRRYGCRFRKLHPLDSRTPANQNMIDGCSLLPSFSSACCATVSSRDDCLKPKSWCCGIQLNVLQQRAPHRLYLTWIDRALFVWLYRGFPRILDAMHFGCATQRLPAARVSCRSRSRMRCCGHHPKEMPPFCCRIFGDVDPDEVSTVQPNDDEGATIESKRRAT